MIAAPLFHAWGFAQWALGISLASTVVLKRKFDEEATLSLTAQHECTALVVVPVMIQRILELDDEVLDRYDLSKVRAVPVCGSALPGSISDRWMDHFGENLYNLYGSTEVAWATIATPRDLREAPGTAGRPPRGSVVKIYDEDGKPVPAGRERAHLRRQRRPVRGLHGRRQQGRDRRAAVLRRRRPLRRRGPPVHRRPRRRHDRLRRRERLPGRGRGPAARPRERRRRRGLRRRRREVRPAPEGRDRQEGRRSPRRTSRTTSRRTSRATRPRATSSSSTSSRAPPPGRCLSASSRTLDPKLLRRACLSARTSSISARLGLTSGEGRRLDLHVARRPVRLRRLALRRRPGARARAARHLPHHRRRLGAAAALRGARSTARACAASSTRRRVRRRLLRGPPAGRAATDLISPYLEDGELDLQALGARRARARPPDPDHVPPGLRRPVRAVRREPQRGPRPRARGASPTCAGRSSPS